jgi:hypothetical protein
MRGALETALRGDVHFCANDGLDTGFFASVVELNDAEQIAIVSHSHGRHTDFFGAVYEIFYMTNGVQEAVLSVKV